MNLLAPVSKLMTKQVITVSDDDPLFEIGEIFEKHNIHHLPVIDMGELVGMVSKTDYLHFKRGFEEMTKGVDEIRLRNKKVKDIMTTGLAKLDATDKLNVALEVFKINKFHALPVMEGKKLVGIITTFDIIKTLAEDKIAVNEYERK